MARAIGSGGIFFKSRDPKASRDWHARHLGIDTNDCDANFAEDASRPGFGLWAPFRMDTGRFMPSTKEFMPNFRVDNLDALIASLGAEDFEVDPNLHEGEAGRCGWIMDPQGKRIEPPLPPSAKMPT